MKRTRAAKLAAKRGARFKPALISTREPNGRLSRRQQRTELLEHQIMDVAVSRRIRHMGLVDKGIETAFKQAQDPRRGYVLGILYLDGKITEAQHDVGVRYSNEIAKYYGLTGVGFPSARAQNLFAIRGEDGEVTETRANRAREAIERRNATRAALLATGDINTARRVLHTVNAICVEDIEQARGWPEHMIALLRNGLNKLGKFYER